MTTFQFLQTLTLQIYQIAINTCTCRNCELFCSFAQNTTYVYRNI